MPCLPRIPACRTLWLARVPPYPFFETFPDGARQTASRVGTKSGTGRPASFCRPSGSYFYMFLPCQNIITWQRPVVGWNVQICGYRAFHPAPQNRLHAGSTPCFAGTRRRRTPLSTTSCTFETPFTRRYRTPAHPFACTEKPFGPTVKA